jgi:hypothetical protein
MGPPPDRTLDSRESDQKLSHDLCRRQPEDTIAEPLQLTIAPTIGARTTRVIPAIYLDDELRRRGKEVHDEAPAQQHLPPKHDPELPTAQRLPKARLRLRHRTPVSPGVLLELHLPSMSLELS